MLVLTSASGVSDLSQEEAGTPKPALVEMQLLMKHLCNGRNATPLARIAASVSSIGKELYQYQLPMVTRKSTSSVYAGKRDTYKTVHLSSHPEEPQCSYDPIEGLTLAESINPADKIRQLEEQICMCSLQSVKHDLNCHKKPILNIGFKRLGEFMHNLPTMHPSPTTVLLLRLALLL